MADRIRLTVARFFFVRAAAVNVSRFAIASVERLTYLVCRFLLIALVPAMLDILPNSADGKLLFFLRIRFYFLLQLTHKL